MAFVDVVKERKLQDESAAYRQCFHMWPRQWKKYVNTHSWQMCRLSTKARSAVPSTPGIYTILVQPGVAGHPACAYLMYVGKTTSLRRRFGEYLNEKNRATGRPHIVRVLNLYPRHTWFCFTSIKHSKLKSVESSLTEAYMPPYNKDLPASIRRIVKAFPNG